MKKTLAIAVCCILPVIIIGFLFSRGNQKGLSVADQQVVKTSDDSVAVGNPFPDFAVTEVDSRTISQDSLKGKPAIIWFTTSWCVPCQIGAKEVARLDNELGGKTFEVLVIFVDPKETDADLVNWKKQFANPDWIVAFDNELTNLAKRINLKFLDSKFLLDKNSAIKNIDFKIADENYFNIIRQTVKENE